MLFAYNQKYKKSYEKDNDEEVMKRENGRKWSYGSFYFIKETWKNKGWVV